MPLIILTGVPLSGKTTRAQELKTYFEEQGKEVIIVSEENEIKKASFNKNTFYQDAQKEKQIRGTLKSEIMRVIGPKNLVILDAQNYIKGYRYELYCATKANNCTQCTIQCIINFEEAFKRNKSNPNENDKYTREVFDAICLRYENPDSKNRWDSPLFYVQPTDDLDYHAIFQCLFEKNAPKPNMSTQNAPLSNTNYLFELDKITSDISQSIITAKKLYQSGEFHIPSYPNLSINLNNVTIAKINMLRRQYIVYSKMHTPDIVDIPKLYVQYLRTSFTLCN